MRLLSTLSALLPSLLLLPTSCSAIYADEAYKIDYHHALLGIPTEGNTFVHAPVAATKASLIYTLSEKGLIGAVNPKDGAVVWRQRVANETSAKAAVLRAPVEGAGNGDLVVSASGNKIQAWRASDGRLVWSQSVEEGAVVRDVKFLEMPGVSGDEVQDVIVLYEGTQPKVERRSGKDGRLMWTFTDTSGDSPYAIGLTGSTVHLVSLHGAMLGGYKIRVTHVNHSEKECQKTEQITLSDGDVASVEDILFVGGTSVPVIAWTDKSFKAVKVNVLGTKTVVSLPVDKKDEETTSIKIHAPKAINALPHFLVQYSSTKSHWAQVYHIDLKKGAVTKAYDLPKLADQGGFSASTANANVYFTRIAKGALSVTSSASHGVVERYILHTFVPGVHGNPAVVFAVSEVMPYPGGSRAAVRTAALLSSGDFVLVLNGETAWSRPEALTLAQSAVFAELPHGERLARELAIEEHASIPAAYVHRLKRHISELQGLPKWLSEQPGKIMESVMGVTTVGGLTQEPDKFGFNKIVVVATSNGRLIGVDVGSGGLVAWNQPIPDYTDTPDWQIPSLNASAPGIVRVRSPNGHWVYSMDGYLVREGAAGKPKTDSGSVQYEIVDGQVKGFLGGEKSTSVWSFKPKPGGKILSVTARPSEDPVASIGTVLGDRSVLYKYLNPNLALIISADEKSGTATATLVDTASGAILYEASHAGVDITRPIPAAVSQNWLTYTYTLASGPSTPSRGHILVTAHLMESAFPNDRGALGANGNYSALRPLGAETATPHVVSQSYQIPQEVSSLAVTHTRQGITSRMLLAVLPNTQALVGIPLSAIDPRRPVGRDPTPNEAMEGLSRYVPFLDFPSQWNLNHAREVLGIDKVVANPAVLESTSNLFAFGLDVFGTRVTPSGAFDVLGKSFNKLQMLATVAALFVGVVVVGPLVKRKQINMRWSL